jgi:molybdopterin molybdotransferase
MLRVAEAQETILRHSNALTPQMFRVAPGTLGAAVGLVLAEDVVSDIDMPPYDKSMMDGYAVRSADLATGQAILTVIEEITAGQTPQRPVGSKQAARIMTGAPIPAGADAVVQIERTRMLENHQVQIDDRPPTPGKNILVQAREMRRGETILPAGMILRPPSIGLLSTVGRTTVQVHPQPTVAVIATGDEMVEADQLPGPGQIRNSNGPMLTALASRAGGLPRYLGIARDKVESLQSLIADGLQSAVLLLSGGVSAGKLDLVPGVLQDLGVQPHFHKVEMKPGKPIFFGIKEEHLVFGLPGNPVSALVCFELFVRPAIRRLMGHRDAGTEMVPMPLAEDFTYSTDRPTYHPACVEAGPQGWRVRAVPWFGSADLRALAQTNALVLFPAGDHRHEAGQLFPVLRTEE